MPGFDRTGPMGAGPMTGGVRGHCNSATAGMTPAFAGSYGNGRGQGLRRGFRGGSDSGMGRGRGFGRGYRWSRLTGGPVHQADAASEMEMLKADADYMQKSLDAINKRIDELSEKPAEAS